MTAGSSLSREIPLVKLVSPAGIQILRFSPQAPLQLMKLSTRRAAYFAISAANNNAHIDVQFTAAADSGRAVSYV